MRAGALFLSFFVAIGAGEAESLLSYVHTATSASIGGLDDEWTELDHRLVNDDPNARLLVTQNWNPPGSPGIYNDHVVGLVYIPGLGGGGRWYILNEDDAAMPEEAAFNVLILGPDSLSFVHHTSDENSSGRASAVEPIDPDCLLCPIGTKMLYTHTFTAFGLAGSSFDYHSSILYGGPGYSIVTESRIPGFSQPMPPGVFFNVLIADSPGIASSPGSSFHHLATPGNLAFNYTLLAHPELDGNPASLVFVARTGPALTNSPHELGVWYTGSVWSIFFQDQTAAMIDGSTYTVYIPPMMSDGFESGDVSWWSDSSGFVP